MTLGASIGTLPPSRWRKWRWQSWAPDGVRITTYGNVMSACSFLQGLAAEELLPEHLDTRDEDFEVIVAAQLQKEAA